MLYLTPMLTAYILILAFIFGAVFASFLGCMGWRIAHKESISKGRSHCDTCGHVLGARDLIPIISFLARKGRCGYCGAPISKSTLVGEIVLAVVFVVTTMRYDVTPMLVLSLFFICILYLLTMVDIYIQEIPDACLAIAIVARVIYYFVFEGFAWKSLLELIGNGLSVSLPLLLLTLLMEKLLQKEAMGGGDIKLIFVTGMYLGWQKNLLMLLIACIVGIVVGILQSRGDSSVEEEEGMENYFPFGPAIAIATVFTMWIGDGVLDWYMSLF